MKHIYPSYNFWIWFGAFSRLMDIKGSEILTVESMEDESVIMYDIYTNYIEPQHHPIDEFNADLTYIWIEKLKYFNNFCSSITYNTLDLKLIFKYWMKHTSPAIRHIDTIFDIINIPHRIYRSGNIELSNTSIDNIRIFHNFLLHDRSTETNLQSLSINSQVSPEQTIPTPS